LRKLFWPNFILSLLMMEGALAVGGKGGK